LPDILLIQPPFRDFYLTAKRTIPYGLASIAAALIRDGFTVDLIDALATSKSRIVDIPEEMTYLRHFYGKPDVSPFGMFHHFRHFGYSYAHIRRLVQASNPFLVGISALFTPYFESAIETARIVKECHPDCRVVLGGHHPTVLPETVMDSGVVDFVLRGEGEVSMPMLAQAVKQGLPVRSVPGIVCRNEDGSLFVREPAVSENLDGHPLPADHLVRKSFYRRGKQASVVVTASRGCPMRCSYCSVNAASCFRYRRRSVASVIAEIETALGESKVGFIDFEDENLSLNRKWFLSLLKEIITRFQDRDLELRAMNGLYPPSLDGKVVAAMKASGFRTLNLSLGTTDAKQLKRFRRPDVTGAFDRAIDLAERFDLNAVGYIIVGAPYQSPGASLKDLLFLAQRRVLVGVSVFYPAPGSADYGLCEKENLLPDSFSMMRSTALPIDHTTTRVASATLLRLGRMLNFMKDIVDRGTDLPCAEPLAEKVITDTKDRAGIGIRLLAALFHDGRMRGVTPEGEVYEHIISADLARKFREAIRTIRVRGAAT
jgi:radical SAM superfamily enzyme YgiQ (UPF0313 family)